MEVLDEWVKWNLVSIGLETVLVSVQYRCMVCAERTIGSEIVLGAPDDTPRMRLKWMVVSVYFEIVVILTQERCAVCVECTIGSEVILDAPDGTPSE
jgi:hypothetical protein